MTLSIRNLNISNTNKTSHDRSIDASFKHLNQSINHVIHSINQSINQVIKSINQSINQILNVIVTNFATSSLVNHDFKFLLNKPLCTAHAVNKYVLKQRCVLYQ